jgi:hypothetical protein
MDLPVCAAIGGRPFSISYLAGRQGSLLFNIRVFLLLPLHTRTISHTDLYLAVLTVSY